MIFVCLHCRASDGHTNGGALFCWDCHDLSEEIKQAALDAYITRSVLLQRTLDEWERAA